MPDTYHIKHSGLVHKPTDHDTMYGWFRKNNPRTWRYLCNERIFLLQIFVIYL